MTDSEKRKESIPEDTEVTVMEEAPEDASMAADKDEIPPASTATEAVSKSTLEDPKPSVSETSALDANGKSTAETASELENSVTTEENKVTEAVSNDEPSKDVTPSAIEAVAETEKSPSAVALTVATEVTTSAVAPIVATEATPSAVAPTVATEATPSAVAPTVATEATPSAVKVPSTATTDALISTAKPLSNEVQTDATKDYLESISSQESEALMEGVLDGSLSSVSTTTLNSTVPCDLVSEKVVQEEAVPPVIVKPSVDTIRAIKIAGFPSDYTEQDVEVFCCPYGIVTKVLMNEEEVKKVKEKKTEADKEDLAPPGTESETVAEPQVVDKRLSFSIEFCSHLDAREFMFQAPTLEGLGMKATPLWTDLSRFALDMAVDFGIMQRLETFFYKGRGELQKTSKTRRMEPKQIYVHGDYKSVGFQTIIDYMKRYGRVLRMQELTGVYEGLVISFESHGAVKSLIHEQTEHMIGHQKFKTRPFYMTKTVTMETKVETDHIWAKGQTYKVPDWVEMSEDWMNRFEGRPAIKDALGWTMITSDNREPGMKVDQELEKGMSPMALIHVFHVEGPMPVTAPEEYRNRLWEGKSIVVSNCSQSAGWRTLQHHFSKYGVVEYVNFIQAPKNSTSVSEERPIGVVTFRQGSGAEAALRNEYHWVEDRRLRVRHHTRCPIRVLAVQSATPGADGLPRAWNTGSDIEQVKRYFEMLGRIDFMMYRRTGIKENEPVIVFQMSKFEHVEEIMYFKHVINNKAVVLKQVRRIPASGPIQLVEEKDQTIHFDASRVRTRCKIEGSRFPPPTSDWWMKELTHLGMVRKAKRELESVDQEKSKKSESNEPEAKRKKVEPEVEAPKAEVVVISDADTAIPMVREKFVNQIRNVTSMAPEDLAYLHVYATKSKDTKTREKFSAVEARSYFEGFGKIKAFWSKKQVMSYVEFAYLDPKVQKQVVLNIDHSITSLPPSSTKLHFTVFPVYRSELDLIPWPVGLHKTKSEWVHLKMAEEEGKFHDQGDAKWIVIRGPSRGHNDTPFRWPTPGRNIGRPGFFPAK